MKIVRDNCKGCNSGCEHAGKDREFVCVKGVSCKTVKPKPDMVAVVRCKDCKHLMFSDCYGECGIARMGIVSPNDFCSYGERKEAQEWTTRNTADTGESAKNHLRRRCKR